MFSQLSVSPRWGWVSLVPCPFWGWICLGMDMSGHGYVWGWVCPGLGWVCPGECEYFQGVGMSRGVGTWDTTGYSRQATGMHPTIMLSCLNQWTLCTDICCLLSPVDISCRFTVHLMPLSVVLDGGSEAVCPTLETFDSINIGINS